MSKKINVSVYQGKPKKGYYSNLNVKSRVGNQKVWKTDKFLFSNKSNNFKKQYLNENGKPIKYDFKIAETFDKYFQNLVPYVDLKVSDYLLFQTPENDDQVLTTIPNTRISKNSSKYAILAFLSNQYLLVT